MKSKNTKMIQNNLAYFQFKYVMHTFNHMDIGPNLTHDYHIFENFACIYVC
uniref:Uncharacterized protein n=1 Tax=Octopus bimaculoides TaxID=37653 RepID=A0A0L8IHX3_OCTBM